MSTNRYSRHQTRSRDDAPDSAPAISRLAYRYEHYRRPADAIAEMKQSLIDGWRIVQIRGPADGPFEVDYLRQVSRDR